MYRGYDAAVLRYVRNVLLYPSVSEVLVEFHQASVLVTLCSGLDRRVQTFKRE